MVPDKNSLHNRKLNRLKGYNYSTEGYYFVTICVNKMICCFGNVISRKMFLNEYGYIVKQQLEWIEKQYPYIRLDEYIVMPNHVHGIIIVKGVGTTLGLSLQNNDNSANRRLNLLSKTICAFKTTSSKLLHQNGLSSFQWQRSYYDHIIRSEYSLLKIQEYIRFNPLKWDIDEYNLG